MIIGTDSHLGMSQLPTSITGASSNVVDFKYLTQLSVLLEVAKRNCLRDDRTDTGTYSVFGTEQRFDISTHLPLLTSKNVHFKSVVEELLWFISGSTNVKDLQARGVSIWNEWADPVTGELNEIYGKQWSRYEDVRLLTEKDLEHFDVSSFELQGSYMRDGVLHHVYRREINQVTKLVESIKNDPYSRRHILNAWNVRTVDEAALAPCHVMYQFYVDEGRLSCKLTQRSGDIFLGVPFNIASAAILTYMLAMHTGLQPGELIHSCGDMHLYSNHIEQATLQVARLGEAVSIKSPTLTIEPKDKITDHTFDDFILDGYNPMGKIPAPVAVRAGT